MSVKLPSMGFVFWPVGTGDCTTIVVDEQRVIQVDMQHLEMANEEDDPHTPIVDRLVNSLPKVNGKPFLAVFALTHPDQDHCRGFKDLLKRVSIGELWFTPRIFREYKKDLCDDAIAFRDEAVRRVRKVIRESGNVELGDRVRIIGFDELLQEEEYQGFPSDLFTVPGGVITEINNIDYGGSFRAFVHAPFKDDADGERNDTSLGMQITLRQGQGKAKALLLGDLAYPTIKRIFEKSQAGDVEWNILLAPHHCSKSVMYWQDESEEQESLKQDVLDALGNAAGVPNYVVASSEPVPATNQPGDNPPHAKAKARYEELGPDAFLCTQEHPNTTEPQPIVFALGSDGLGYPKPKGATSQTESVRGLAAAVASVRGGSQPPTERVGFGRD